MLAKAAEAETELGLPNKISTGIACMALEELTQNFIELQGKFRLF